MAKAKKCDCKAGAPMWVVTYGDLMSLLLTFFVLLLSFATMEETKKYEMAIISIQGAFGIMPKETTAVQIHPMPKPMKRVHKKEEDVARKIRRQLQVVNKQDEVKVKYDKLHGLKITLPSAILFSPGQAVLRPGAFGVLSELGGVLSELPETFLEVRGHTDDQALGDAGTYRDNYDLSYARADSVARFLNRVARIPMKQFEIVACGAGQPVAPNTTDEGRMANRRVDIYLRGLLTDREVKELNAQVKRLTNP